MTNSGNIASDGQVWVRRGQFVELQTLSTAAINRLDPTSEGIVAVAPTGTKLAILDMTKHPTLRLGVSHPDVAGTATYGGFIVPTDRTYRFGGNTQASGFSVGADYETGDTLHITSPLNDGFSGTIRQSVNVGANGAFFGGRVKISNAANSYTGGTTVEANTYLGNPVYLTFDFTPAPGQTPLGTGPVTVAGGLMFEGPAGAWGDMLNPVSFRPDSLLIFNNITYDPADNNRITANNFNRWPDDKPLPLHGTELRFRLLGTIGGANETEAVGDVSYAGHTRVVLDHLLSGPGTATLRAASLARVARGTLLLTEAPTGTFGATSFFASGTRRPRLAH